MAYEHLFSPVQLGTVEVKNRIAMAPMGTGVYNPDDTVPEVTIPYVEARAKGGTGLIITQFGRASKYQTTHLMGVFEDRFIPGLKRYAAAVHMYDAKVFLQIAALGGKDPQGSYAPSAIKSPLYKIPPIELTAEQIEEIIGEFIQAGRRAQEAGFDGVELHGAHSYLIGQFISPHANQRTDAYGGDFERRMRVPVEIVRGIKKVCGADFPVGFKFSAYEEVPNGVNHVLAPQIAQRMVDEGVVYIHAASTASTIEALSKYPSVPPLYMPRNTLLYLAENVHRTVKDVPIMATGSIVDPQDADDMIAQGKADMVALGRALLADPAWANKAKEGRRIRPCIRCNVCHYEAVFKWKKILCTVNPYLAREPEEPMVPAAKRKNVMVVGGGPGGIMAALAAARRGHEVLLYEQRNELGGMLVPGSHPPFKADVRDLLNYYRGEVADSSVQVELGKDVTPAEVNAVAPDALIVATGACSVVPDLPGADSEHVMTAVEALRSRDDVKGAHVVVIGGGDVGCETALYLAQADKKVAIVEMLDELMAEDEMKNNTMVLKEMLKEAGVEAYTGCTPTEITSDAVYIRDTAGATRTLPADTVVLSVGLKPDTAFVDALRAACAESYALGDCVDPKRIKDAVHEGDRVGRLV